MDHDPLKLLVLSSFDGRNANVIRDFLFSFNKYSLHDYYYIFDCQILDKDMDFSMFDVILIFWSVYLPGSELSEEARAKIRQSRALKMLFLQDEYRDVRLFNQIMSELGIQVMFTCVAERDHEVFYPGRLIPSLQSTYSVLTGYIPNYLESYRFDSTLSRPLDLSYRSRIVPYYLGDLGQEKKIIADRFQNIALEYGYKSDISVREQDRIYGDRWVKFMKSSRFVLGTPSGASVIDFTGEIRRNCENYLILHPDATYEEVKQKFFVEEDWKAVIDTVSPRIFETAALGCTMVMHEGEYGGILQPGKHYVAVKKNYSNIDEVVAQMRDESYCRQLSQNAYRDLVSSGRYSYREFIRGFDQILGKHVNKPIRRGLISKSAFYTKNYFKYGESIIPNSDQFYVLPFGTIIRSIKWLSGIVRKFIAIVNVPELRKLFFAYLSHQMWKSLRPGLVLADLMRLNLLIRLQAKELTTKVPFRVNARFDTSIGKLTFESHLAAVDIAEDSANNAGFCLEANFPVSMLESALLHGKVGVFEWDHSSVGKYIYCINRQGQQQVLDMNFGQYSFQAISEFARRFPTQTWAAFARVFNSL